MLGMPNVSLVWCEALPTSRPFREVSLPYYSVLLRLLSPKMHQIENFTGFRRRPIWRSLQRSLTPYSWSRSRCLLAKNNPYLDLDPYLAHIWNSLPSHVKGTVLDLSGLKRLAHSIGLRSTFCSMTPPMQHREGGLLPFPYIWRCINFDCCFLNGIAVNLLCMAKKLCCCQTYVCYCWG